MVCKVFRFAISALMLVLLSPLGQAQEDETYDFDGVADSDPQPDDPTDWMTSENWSDGGSDPFGEPFGPLLPDLDTRVEIEEGKYGVNAPVIGPGDTAEAFGVRIGRSGGEGLLTMTGGTLDLANSCDAPPFSCNRRLRVGAANTVVPEDRNPGTFDLSSGEVNTDTLWIGSGSLGTMNMSHAVVNTRGDLSFDWSFDAGSVLNMTAGVINVGVTSFAYPIENRSLRMYRNSVLNLDGGKIFVDGFAGLGYSDVAVTQTPNVSVNISKGVLESADFLRVEGSVVMDGGILRAGSFNEALSTGTVEINGNGRLQFDNAQESVEAVQGLVTSGFFTTTDASPLIVELVTVCGNDYTQVSTVGGWITGGFDTDDAVDGFDFLKWQRGGSPTPYSASDFQDWETGFGTAGGGPLQAGFATVPEPSAAALALLACLALVCRRGTH